MAKQQDNSPPLLVRDKQELKDLIAERIKRGVEILTIPVTNQQEKEDVWVKFMSWDKVNREIIANAFNRRNHKHEYTYKYKESVDILGGLYVGPQRQKTLAELINEEKEDIQFQLTKLQEFHDVIDHLQYVPGFKPAPLISQKNNSRDGYNNLIHLLSRFHKVARKIRHRHDGRPTLEINDEYDVQGLLKGLLQIYFDDVRPEDPSPSSAGGSSRIDFVLKLSGILLEVKMTNERLRDKKLGEELAIDIARYRSYPDCKDLVIFIYDKDDFIANKHALKGDLERLSVPEFKVTVVINPE